MFWEDLPPQMGKFDLVEEISPRWIQCLQESTYPTRRWDENSVSEEGLPPFQAETYYL